MRAKHQLRSARCPSEPENICNPFSSFCLHRMNYASNTLHNTQLNIQPKTPRLNATDNTSAHLIIYDPSSRQSIYYLLDSQIIVHYVQLLAGLDLMRDTLKSKTRGKLLTISSGTNFFFLMKDSRDFIEYDRTSWAFLSGLLRNSRLSDSNPSRYCSTNFAQSPPLPNLHLYYHS